MVRMDAQVLDQWIVIFGLILFSTMLICAFRTSPDLSELFRWAPDARQDNTRLQAFVFSLISIIGYALSALAWHPEPNVPPIMPDIPPELLVAVGGSHMLYLTKKYLDVKTGK